MINTANPTNGRYAHRSAKESSRGIKEVGSKVMKIQRIPKDISFREFFALNARNNIKTNKKIEIKAEDSKIEFERDKSWSMLRFNGRKNSLK